MAKKNLSDAYKSLFINKSCISIFIDKSGFVYGVSFANSPKKIKVVDYCSNKNPDEDIFTRIREVYNSLRGFSKDKVLISGVIEKSLVLELEVPSLKATEIRSYLSFELPRHIPIQLEGTEWGFYPIENDKKDGKFNKVKIVIYDKGKIESFRQTVIKSGIKFDSIVDIYEIIDVLCPNEKVNVKVLSEEFSVDTSDSSVGWNIRKQDKKEDSSDIKNKNLLIEQVLSTISEDQDFYEPCVIMALFTFRCNFSLYEKYGIEIPFEVKPKRQTALRQIAILLLVIFLVLFAFYSARKWTNNYRVVRDINSQYSLLNNEFDKVEAKIKSTQKTDVIIKQILAAKPNDIDPIDLLNFLSTSIGNDSWINYLNTYGNSCSVTLQTKGTGDNLVANFYNSPKYSLMNSRKNKGGEDGTTYIYANFESKQ